MKRERVRFLILAAVCSLSACGGGGGSAPSVAPTPLITPTPTPTATPAPPAVSPASVDLMGAGAAQSVAINEPGYNGSITIDATKCDGIATASVASVQGPAATFTVTAAQQGGTCAITLTNSLGESQTVPVSVTITQGVIN